MHDPTPVLVASAMTGCVQVGSEDHAVAWFPFGIGWGSVGDVVFPCVHWECHLEFLQSQIMDFHKWCGVGEFSKLWVHDWYFHVVSQSIFSCGFGNHQG